MTLWKLWPLVPSCPTASLPTEAWSQPSCPDSQCPHELVQLLRSSLLTPWSLGCFVGPLVGQCWALGAEPTPSHQDPFPDSEGTMVRAEHTALLLFMILQDPWKFSGTPEPGQGVSDSHKPEWTWATSSHPSTFQLSLCSRSGPKQCGPLCPSLASLPLPLPTGNFGMKVLLCAPGWATEGPALLFLQTSLPLAMQGPGQENVTFSSLS